MTLPLETRAMPTLLEQRNNLISEMETLVNTAKTETRAFTDEENTRFNTISDELGKIDKTLAAESKANEFRANEPKLEVKKDKDQEERSLEIQKFERFLRGEERALDVANNGAIVPQEIANRIITRVRELSPILQKCTTFNVGGDLIFPKFDQYSLQTAYISDMTALTAQNGNFTTLKLQNFIAGCLVQISRSLMNRTDFDLTAYMVNYMGQSIANFMENELLNGVGTTAATGLFVDSNVTNVTAAGTTGVTVDDLITCQFAIPQVLQNEAVWLMSKSLASSIRKLKTTYGEYLLNQDVTQPFGWSLLGKPVYFSENAPSNIATGQKVLAYGDLSGMYCKFSQQVQMQILNELYATQHAVGAVAYVEFDSRVVEDQKLAVMSLA